MFEGAEAREKEKWRHTLYQMQDLRDVISSALGGKAQGIETLYKKTFGAPGKGRRKWASAQEHGKWLRAAHTKVLANHRRRNGDDS